MKPLLALLAVAASLAAPDTVPAQTPATAYGTWKQDRPTRLGAVSPSLWIRMDTVGTWVLVPGSPDDVYRKALLVYGTLKLKTPLVDSAAGILGNPGFQQTGSLAGQRMSAWIGCGEGMTGPNADTWRVTMAVLSSVERVTKDTTRLRTLVVASAKNLAEGGRVPTDCSSTGEMERQIHTKVQAMPPTPSGNE